MKEFLEALLRGAICLSFPLVGNPSLDTELQKDSGRAGMTDSIPRSLLAV